MAGQAQDHRRGWCSAYKAFSIIKPGDLLLGDMSAVGENNDKSDKS